MPSLPETINHQLPNFVYTAVMRPCRRVLALLLLFCALVSPAQGNREILVSAAISLKSAFEEIRPVYEKQAGVAVRFNFGASGLLAKQIEAGAPVDVFASAGEGEMRALEAGRMIYPETKRNMARNVLVLIVPIDSRLSIRSFSDLADPGLERIAIGNPRTVPAGRYAREALRYLGIWDRLQPRLILAENVRQALDYVMRGEVQAGIVYASDTLIARGKVSVTARAPEGSHSPIAYPVAVVRGTRHRGEAQRFIDLVLGRTGQNILAKHGFLPSR